MYFFSYKSHYCMCHLFGSEEITRAEFGIGGFLGLGFEFVAESNGRCCGI